FRPKDPLVDGANALGDAVHGHELRLHVGGKARVRLGHDVDRLRAAAAHVDSDAVALDGGLGAGFGQLLQHGGHGFGAGAGGGDVAAGHGGGDQEGAGLDAVWQHGVPAAGQALHAVHHDAAAAGAFDVGAQGDEAVGQVDDFRLTRGVVDHGGAGGQAGGHQRVLGGAHAHHREADVAAAQ